MGQKIHRSGSPSGFQYESIPLPAKSDAYDAGKKKKEDKDLVIEENTVYEIDRECYERLKRQRRRKF